MKEYKLLEIIVKNKVKFGIRRKYDGRGVDDIFLIWTIERAIIKIYFKDYFKDYYKDWLSNG